jgi:TRAP-type C4-dicarboxylate transport system permease large subunit
MAQMRSRGGHVKFSTSAQFKRVVKETGQTTADILFRVRANLVYAALLKAEHVSQRVLNTESRREYRPQTICARDYVIADCAGA